MNREDAAREIDNTACCFSDKRFRDAMHMAAAALRGPQPDPITGLVPCGCGGEAVRYGRDSYNSFFTTVCSNCGTISWGELLQDEADKSWNTAMGYIAPPIPSAMEVEK